nr:lecithin retinol acyltransferase family protein [Pseudomonas gregormendelii]
MKGWVVSLSSLVLFRSGLVDANLVSCLNSPISEHEVHVRSAKRGASQDCTTTHLNLRRVGLATNFLTPGTHLVSPRKLYIHHGIYLGDGTVAHYSGLSGSLKAGPIEITHLEHFANGHSVWVYQDHPAFTSDEIVVRARSRIGESKYKILSNNCEHFCTWCISGASKSAQVDEYLHFPLRLIHLILAPEPGLLA